MSLGVPSAISDTITFAIECQGKSITLLIISQKWHKSQHLVKEVESDGFWDEYGINVELLLPDYQKTNLFLKRLRVLCR